MKMQNYKVVMSGPNATISANVVAENSSAAVIAVASKYNLTLREWVATAERIE